MLDIFISLELNTVQRISSEVVHTKYTQIDGDTLYGEKFTCKFNGETFAYKLYYNWSYS